MKSRKNEQAYAVMISIPGQAPAFARLKGGITRVGSHPSCEIRLPENYATRLLAIVEIRAAAVVLHNKSGQPFSMDEFELEPNRSATWFDGQSIDINSYVRLTLIAKIKPALPGNEESLEPDHDAVVFTPKTIFCLVASVLIVGYKILSFLMPGEQPPDRMVELVRQAQHARVDDPVKREISFRLQKARIAWLRDGKLDEAELAAASRMLVQQRIQRSDGPADVWYDEAYEMLRLLLKIARDNA